MGSRLLLNDTLKTSSLYYETVVINDIPEGTLRAIIKQADITIATFL